MEKIIWKIELKKKNERKKKAKRFLYLFMCFCILISAIPGFTVPAYAGTAPSISPAAALFDKNTEGGAYTDIDIVMTLDGCTLSGIRNDSTPLTQETDYTVSGSMVTLRKEYLETLDFNEFIGISTHTLTFDFSDGSSAALVVTLVNTDRPLPRGVTVDADGNIYFASDNFVMELAMVDHIQFGISMQAGKTYIIAGTGKRGSSGHGVDARKSDLDSPTDVAVDADGNIYITTFMDNINGGHTIREVANTSHTQWGIDMTAGYIYNIAGDPTSQSGGYAGDNGPAADAKFNSIADVVVDADGNLYISDCVNSRVRIMAAKNCDRWGISMTAGYVYTIAGTGARGYSGDGGPATEAELYVQRDLGLDADGNLYIFDYGNVVIREVAAANHEQYGISMTAGSIYTVAGKFGAEGPPYAGDGTKATEANCGIGNMAVDKDGNIYIRSSGIRIVAADDGVQWGIDMTAGNIYSPTRNSYYCYLSPTSEIAVDASGNNLYLLGLARIHTLIKEHNLASPTRFIYDKNTAGPDYSDINISVDSRYGSLMFLSVCYEEDSETKGAFNVLPSTGPINYTLSGNTVTIPKSYLSSLTPGRTYYVNTVWNSGLTSTSEIHIVDSSYDSMARDILIDAAGNRYIATGHNVIEVPANDGLQWGINMSKGKPYIIAGNSTAGYGGDGGVSALRAVFDKTSGVVNTASGDVYKSILNIPLDMALDSEGNLFILDNSGRRVRMVAARDGTLFGMDVKFGNIYTVAGCGEDVIVTPDGQPAVQSYLRPAGIALDSYGNLYITDLEKDSVRIVARTTQDRWGISMAAGHMYTLAGSQPNELPNEYGDYFGYSGDGGPAASSKLYDPYGIAFDTSGNLYIADDRNNVIRMIAANDGAYWGIPMTANYIYTIAGKEYVDPGLAYTGDGGDATDATMRSPAGLAFDAAGNLYIADCGNGVIREVVAKNNKIYTVISGYTKYLTFDSAGNLYFWDHWPMQAPLPNDAGLSSVLGQTISTVGTGADVSSPMQATVNVDSSVTAVTSSDIAAVHSDAVVTFYGADSSFTAPAAGSVSLTEGGATHVYVKVKAPAGLELFYDVTVNRAAAVVPVTLESATADGESDTTTSTKIDFTFDTAIAGLTASDITITDGTGAAVKGALTGSGTNWSIALTSVTTQGDVSVAVSAPAGYSISGSPKTVAVYKAVVPTSVTLQSAVADGVADTTTSTKIDFTFDTAITGLTASDITITDGTGAAVKGDLTGSGTNWSIALTSVTTQGDVSVAVSAPAGYTISGSPKTVAVYKAIVLTPVTLQAAVADGESDTTTSTKIDFTFDTAIAGLTASDITITDGTGAAVKGALTGSGTNWSIALTSVTTQGDVSVAVSAPAGYTISGSPKTVAVYKAVAPTVTVTSVTVAPPTASVQKGTTQTFTAAVYGTNSPAQTVTWSVYGNTSVSTTINASGLLTVAADETAATLTVTATSTVDNSKSGTATVTVTTTPPAFVAVTNITNVPATATAGTPLTLTGTVAPADATNQTVAWSVYNAGDTGASIVGNTLSTTATGIVVVRVTITNGLTESTDYTQDFNITVAAAPIITYTITASANSGGSISPDGSVSVTEGSSHTFTITSNSGYQINSVTVDGVNQGAITTYTFTNVTANHTINATFTRTSGGGGDGGGSNTPSTPTTPTYYAGVKVGSDTETPLSVTVDKNNGSASVDIVSQGNRLSDGENLTISIPSIPGVDTYSVGIPVESLSSSDGQGTLTLNTDAGSITVPSNMMTGVAGISGSEAGISIGQGDKSNLPEDVKDAIGDKPLIQLTLSIDGKQTDWSNPDAPVTVSIPYTPTAEELAHPESIVVWYIDGSGNVVTISNGRYDAATGTVNFFTTHFSDYAVVYVHKTFSDLGSVEWARKAIEVMASKGITNGTGDGTTFSPNVNITRADFTVLLIKTLGLTAEFTENFDDVKPGTYYYNAIGVAKKLGIAAGIGNNRFKPTESISRQDMMVLVARVLEKYQGLETVDNSAALESFSDKKDIAEYAVNSLATLVESGLIEGSGNKLTPRSFTTRAEVAAFLYKIYNKYPEAPVITASAV